MIRWLFLICAVMGLTLSSASGAATTYTFPLITGEEYTGEAMGPDARGVLIKKTDGTITERIGWTNFTQVALKNLSKALPRAMRWIEPLLEEDEPVQTRPRASAPNLKYTAPSTRLERPDKKAGIGNLFDSALTGLILFLLYAGNIYAAYEISLFRNYAPALVCGLAAVVPVIGPAIFLCVPTRIPEQPQEEEISRADMPEQPTIEAGAALVSDPTAEAAAHGYPTLPPPVIYTRGSTMFNRRFFETKLVGFMRTVPSDAEKDLVIAVRSARGEYVAQKISKVQPNEVYFHVLKGGASTDVAIPFSEILEIKIRHKDDVK